jgi:hypothetical protein
MTPSARWLTSVGLIALTVSVSCRPSAEKQAADAARNTSEAAASPQQKQLWQDAAKQGAAPGLERVPVVRDPVTKRQRIPAPTAQPQAPPTGTITIAQGVQSEIRILVYPNMPFESYTGPATVVGVDQNNERIQLNLGPRGTLTLLVRIGGQQLPLAKGETVNVSYQQRQNPQVPNDVIAIQKAGGAGIGHIIRGGTSPVQAVIPLFGITATQLAAQPGLPVQVMGPALKPIDLTMGQTVPAGDVTVRLLGSTGVGPGTDVGLIEGSPFTINVMVWKVP